MSDERDETRRHAPFGDARPGGGQADDGTRRMPPADDPTVRGPRPDSTSIMPPTSNGTGRNGTGRDGTGRDGDEWAPSRINPAWSGRAEVRPPSTQQTTYEQEDWASPPDRRSNDRWWMPIVVGAVVLILLAALAFGIYLIVKNADRNSGPSPSTTTSAAPAPTTAATTTATTTPPTTEPTTTEPTTTPPTTEPTSAIPIPALDGLAVNDAKNALTAVGLTSRVIYRPSTSPAGTVIDSDPQEGQEVPPGSTVTLVVAAPSTSSPTPVASANQGG